MSPTIKDKILFITLRGITGLSILFLFFIFFFLGNEAWPFITEIGFVDIFLDESWHPTSGEFWLLPMIVGSLLIMLGAVLLSIPIAFFTALFCQFYAPKWASEILKRIIEVLAGIPSVIYGFWGILVLVPILASFMSPGTSVLAGIIVLTCIILPHLFLITNNALESTEEEVIRNAMSLGLARHSIILHVILPSARSQLYTGVILQSGRAIGETLAVLMVCGNVVQLPGNIFEPVRTLTSNIALEMAYAMDTHRSALFFSGLILLFMVVSLVLLIDKTQARKSITL